MANLLIISSSKVCQNGGLHTDSSLNAHNKSRVLLLNCIGEVVRIIRPSSKRSFGIIKRFDNKSKKHLIMFDDGDTEFLDMSKEDWEFCNHGM